MTRLSLRFLFPLAVVLAVLAFAMQPLVGRLTEEWFRRDLYVRGQLVASLLNDELQSVLTHTKSKLNVQALFDRVIHNDPRLVAIGLCNSGGQYLYRSTNFPSSDELPCRTQGEQKAKTRDGRLLHLSTVALQAPSTRVNGYLLLAHDMTFVLKRTKDSQRYIFYLFLVVGLLVSLVTVIVAQLSWRGWISGMKAVLRGEMIFKPYFSKTHPEFQPVLKELRTLVRDLESDSQVKVEASVSWNAKSLRDIMGRYLANEEVMVVSNREPYIHLRKGDKIEVQFPASGLVSAVEPIMRACSGTWVAHGSGSADRDVVDKDDTVAVPPGNPSYRLKRVWLTEEEESGYYYGFSNEGLWPLCHIAHVRPVFRQSDWEMYRAVNEKFADVIAATAKSRDPVILVQDYHFALLPKMLRERLPRATILTFWHIPWPNSESFGICPWREEILEGMLGSTILGFHTRFHCNNFLDTVDRFLESRIDREQSTISYLGKQTAVRQYPISIEWPPSWLASVATAPECRKRVLERHQISPDVKWIGVGVDRMDYTKGILERIAGLERFFELYPDAVGKLTFLELAAPSRSRIERYQFFHQEVDIACARLNERFGKPGYSPIVLLAEHHEPTQVFEYYRAADFCFVSSLHDGMNLVAKEFVAARDDEKGVLILSMFTGAARELPEAFIVNPYNADQCAEAIKAATEMSENEQRERMRAMRAFIREFNVFRWAGRMLGEAVRVRQRHRLSQRIHDWEFQQKDGVGL